MAVKTLFDYGLAIFETDEFVCLPYPTHIDFDKEMLLNQDLEASGEIGFGEWFGADEKLVGLSPSQRVVEDVGIAKGLEDGFGHLAIA